MSRYILFALLISLNSYAQNLSQSFPAGKGASYKVKFVGGDAPVELSVYIAGTRVDSVHVEYFMQTKELIPVQLWQQFEIAVQDKKPAKVQKGFVYAKELARPETIPAEYLAGASGGIQVNDFLFAEKSQLDKNKVGEEIVEISAGSTKATHYRVSNNGQTIDYWISDDAKPMGLVMLISRNPSKPSQNYSLELTHLIDNIKPKILPENAGPISDKGKAFLAKPTSIK